MKQNKPVPELRFKEFNDEWVSKPLRDVITLTTRPLKMKDEQSYSLVTIKRRYEGVVHRGDFKGKEIKVKSQFLLEENDFVISKRQISHNACGLVPKELAGSIVSNEYSVFVPQKNTHIDYFNYFCHLPKVSKTFYLSSIGVHIEKMLFKVDVWLKRKFYFPSLPEQQKIASFLSAIDEKIRQLTRKKELLEQYKKGVMQQLFPPPGEHAPKLRFKDENGKDYPEWVDKLYGDVFSFYPTNSFSRENLNYESGIVKNIHYGDIHTKFSTLFNIKNERVPYVNKEISISNIKKDSYCQEGDLVIADASEDYADIGKAIELVELDDERVIAGLHTFLARPNKLGMHKGFSGQLVKASFVHRQMMTIAQGTKVLSLSSGRLSRVKLKIPCIAEQQKIATYISIVDAKINTVALQITQTQTFKKGLLQQMFV